MSLAERNIKREEKEQKRKVSLTVLLAAAGILVAGAAVWLLLSLNTKRIEAGIYYYDTGVRYDQKDAVIRNEGENGVYLDFKNGGRAEKLALTSAPLYYADRKRIFLPTDTTITLPSQRKVFKAAKFSEFEDRQGTIFASIGGVDYKIGEGFLYDGKNMFVFLDHMTISWNGKAIDMPPLSYAIAVYNQRVEFYPFGGEPLTEQTGTADILASADKGYTVDLSTGVLTNAEGFESLLISEPSLMEPFAGES